MSDQVSFQILREGSVRQCLVTSQLTADPLRSGIFSVV